MSRLRDAFEAHARGELPLAALRARIGRLARRAPRSAPNLLTLITSAYEDEQLGAPEMADLKAHLHQALFHHGPDGHGQAGDSGHPAARAQVEDATAATLGPSGSEALTRRPALTGTAQSLLGLSVSELAMPTVDGIWLPPLHRPDGSGRLKPGELVKQRFQLLEVLGAGGMGTVFKGIDLLRQEARDRNPFIALKVLNEDFRRHPDAFIALQREASRQQKLAHPNIATVHDFDRTDHGVVYIVMELLQGMALNRYIRKRVRPRGGMPLHEAWPIVEALCEALAHAHERGVVHSDFKPGNCFLTRSGGVKVLDFGMARAVSNPARGDSEKTLFDPARLGALTPAYASAEMLEGEQPDPRDDLYALACVVYELLAGRHPFDKLPASRARELKRRPAPIRTLSGWQNRALRRALAFERGRRTASVQQFCAELSGRRRRRRVSMSIAATVVLALLGLLAAVTVPRQLAEREAEVLVAAIGAEPTALAAQTESIRRLPPLQREIVVERLRPRLSAYYLARADALLAPAEDFDTAAAARLLQEVEVLMPDSALTQQLSDRVEARRRAWEAERELLAAEDRLAALLSAPAPRPEDDAALVGTLGSLKRLLPPASPRLVEAERRVAEFYLRRHRVLLEQNRFAQAAELLARARAVLPERPAFAAAARGAVATREALETQAREQAERTRIAGLKRRFMEAVAGARPEPLEQALASLREALPADDGFMAPGGEGARALSARKAAAARAAAATGRLEQAVQLGRDALALMPDDASLAAGLTDWYTQLAEEAAGRNALDQALALGREAMATLPANSPLRARIERWSARLDAVRTLERLFAGAAVLDTPEARAAVQRLRRDAPDFGARRKALATLLRERVAALPEERRGQAAALLGQGHRLLPGSASLRRDWERARALAEGPLAPVDLAINAGQLSEASDRLGSLLSQPRSQPLVAELQQRLRIRMQAANGARLQYEQALARGDAREALRQLRLAIQLWRDHPDFGYLRRRLEQHIADSPR